MHMTRALAVLFLMTLPAGSVCAQTASPSNITITVIVDSSSAIYTVNTPTFAAMTIEQAMQAAAIQYTATWFPSVPGYAAIIINGMPKSTTGSFGSPYWEFCLNGYTAAAGMQTLTKSGNKIT